MTAEHTTPKPHRVIEPLGENFDVVAARQLSPPPKPEWAVWLRPHGSDQAEVVQLEPRHLLTQRRFASACLNQAGFLARVRPEYGGANWGHFVNAVLDLARAEQGSLRDD
jgi:hypothetical protein